MLESLASRFLADFRVLRGEPKTRVVGTFPHVGEITEASFSEGFSQRTHPEFFEAVGRWAAGFHIRAPWVVRMAVQSLTHWAYHGWTPGEQWVGAVFNEDNRISEAERRFEFFHGGWDVNLSSRPKIEAELRAAFEERLSSYLGYVERMATDRGYVRAPENRRRVKEQPLDHLVWLVRWQVSGWTRREIAEEFGVGVTERIGPAGRQREVHSALSTVRDGLKTGAEFIGLPLRRGKPGRATRPTAVAR